MKDKELPLSSPKNLKRCWAIVNVNGFYGDEHANLGYRDVQRPALSINLSDIIT